MLNLLITGSNSFLGKRFIQKIDRNVYSVYGIDINAQNEKKNNYKFKKIDLNKKTFKIFHGNFDIIVHLAAISNDNDCKSNISNCYKTNIKGTINLLNNINLDRLNKFIFASSEWIYTSGNKASNSNMKIDINNFISHYASTKYLNEKLLKIYSTKYNFININLRFGILYGERIDNFSAFESLVFQTLKKKNKDSIKIGSSKTGRSYLYLNDAVNALLKSLYVKQTFTFDIQGPKFISLKNIILIASKYLNKKINVIEINKKGTNIKKINSEMSKKNLDWSPEINPNKGIEKILKYFKREFFNEI